MKSRMRVRNTVLRQIVAGRHFAQKLSRRSRMVMREGVSVSPGVRFATCLASTRKPSDGIIVAIPHFGDERAITGRFLLCSGTGTTMSIPTDWRTWIISSRPLLARWLGKKPSIADDQTERSLRTHFCGLSLTHLAWGGIQSAPKSAKL